MKHSIRSKFPAFLLMVCLSSCTSIRNDQLFNFRIKEVPDIASKGLLVPEKMEIDPMVLMSYQLWDGKLIVYNPLAPEYLVGIYNIQDGSLMGNFCRRGRGPGEFVSLSSFGVREGRVLLYDMATRKYAEMNIAASLEAGYSIYERQGTMVSDDSALVSIMSVYDMGGNRAIIYNTKQETRNLEMVSSPCYSTVDLESGRVMDSFEVFKKETVERQVERREAVRAFSSTDCISNDGKRLCFAMSRSPIIGIVDTNSGEAIGITVKGQPEFDTKRPNYNYLSACTEGKRIYALYYGIPQDMMPEQKNSWLYVFDWQGHFLSKYELDGCLCYN